MNTSSYRGIDFMIHDNSDIPLINECFGNDPDKLITCCPVGMGCCVYYRRTSLESPG